MHRDYGNRFGPRASNWGIAALCALAASLPFELKVPLFAVGPVGVTSVELLLYIALGLWVATRAGRPSAWSPVHRAALGFALALALSAALASEHRGEAAKFALRQIGGVALLFAAADLASGPSRIATLAAAYVAGAALSGLAAVAEVASPHVAAALLAFKTQPSRVEGLVRASGTLQYANLAAMSWGMALPVAIALWGGARRRGHRALAGSGVLVLAAALVLSASRAGLLTAALVLAVTALAARGPLAGLRVPALAALAAVVGLAGLDLVSRGGLGPSLRERGDRPWFEARVDVEGPLALEAGGSAQVALKARNAGRLPWEASGEHRLSLGYLWLTEPGQPVRVAASLPRDVAPGDTVDVEAHLQAPRAPGMHRVRWVLTGDGLAWVSPGAAELAVEVRPAAGRVPPAADAAVPTLRVQEQPTRPVLWRAGLGLWSERPVFGVGPDNFRRLYARRLGPHALDERVHANSLYVEVLATLGLAGVVALACLAASLGIAGSRALGVLDPGKRLLAAGVLGGLAAFFVHGLVDYGMEATAVYGAFWLQAALLTALSTR